MWNDRKETHTYEWCGEEFTTKAFRDPSFCSFEGRGQRDRTLIGPDHPNWRGGKGLTDEVRRMLDTTPWSERAEEARERDGYDCVMCDLDNKTHSKEYEKALNVHYIIPIRVGGTNDLSNLMTVCIPYHHDAKLTAEEYATPVLIP